MRQSKAIKIRIFKMMNTFLIPHTARILLLCNLPTSMVFRNTLGKRLLVPANRLNPIRNRFPTFEYVLSVLSKIDSPLIVETGCARKDHGLLAWGDDGCSSFLFDIFIRPNKGRLVSVDINEENVNHTNSHTSERVQVFCSDSVKFLSEFQNAEEIDLLYLDSYDFDSENPGPSQNHHLNEIVAIYNRLKSGCMILVDDAGIESKAGELGKAGKVFEFMRRQGVAPLMLNYQILWVKP